MTKYFFKNNIIFSNLTYCWIGTIFQYFYFQVICGKFQFNFLTKKTKNKHDIDDIFIVLPILILIWGIWEVRLRWEVGRRKLEGLTRPTMAAVSHGQHMDYGQVLRSTSCDWLLAIAPYNEELNREKRSDAPTILVLAYWFSFRHSISTI